MRAVSGHTLSIIFTSRQKITVVDIFGSVSYTFRLSILNTFPTSSVLRTLTFYRPKCRLVVIPVQEKLSHNRSRDKGVLPRPTLALQFKQHYRIILSITSNQRFLPSIHPLLLMLH